MWLNKYCVLLLCCFVLLIGCSKNSSSDTIIDEDTFVNLLVDIHMADATLVVKGYKINSDSTTIRLFYNDVLVEHNVTQKQIQNTFEYYTKKPKKFENIYEQVSEKIVKLEEEYDKSIEKNMSKKNRDAKENRNIEDEE